MLTGLDLFCGAGGCTSGYQAAGFRMVGVDIRDQPRYVGDEFVKAHAIAYLAYLIRTGEIARFAFVHASPPCQTYSTLRTMPYQRVHPALVEPTRWLLERASLPYVIENVPGAPLRGPVTICGRSLGHGAQGYQLRRHRLFESNVTLMVPPCACDHRSPTLGIYGDKARDRRRSHDISRSHKIALASEAMGIDWMLWPELTQAIPPAYTELIGAQLLDHLRAKAAA